MESHVIATGIETTIIGMGIVFSVLILLSIMISLLVKIVDKDHNSQNGNKITQNKTVSAPDNKTVANAGKIVSNQESKINAKTIAAIMSAISAMSGRPLANLKFTSIKRKNSVSYKWAEAGKAEIIDSQKFYI